MQFFLLVATAKCIALRASSNMDLVENVAFKNFLRHAGDLLFQSEQYDISASTADSLSFNIVCAKLGGNVICVVAADSVCTKSKIAAILTTTFSDAGSGFAGAGSAAKGSGFLVCKKIVMNKRKQNYLQY